MILANAPAQEARTAILDRILSNPKLLSPPTLALRVVESTRKPDCTIQEISDLLAQDPALCGKLLKTLNSPLYSLSTPVTSLRRAVSILGLKPLRSIVLGLTLPSLHSRVEPDQGLRYYWKDSVAGAIIARELAKRLRHPFPEDDLVASLLRDLGMILLKQTFGEAYHPVWLRTGELADCQQCVWEERHLGVHHAEVSAALLGRWGLPKEIVEPIRFHHHPELVAGRPQSAPPLVQRAYLMEFTSRLAQLEDLADNPAFVQNLLETAQEHFGMERTDLEDFLASVRPIIEEFASILRLDIGACPNFAEILAAGCEELIRLSAEQVNPWKQTRDGHSRTDADSGGAIMREGRPIDPKASGEYRLKVANLTQEFFDKLKLSGAKARIEQFHVEGLIGRGAMGIVLKAHDPGLNRPVALKFLAPELAGSSVAQQRFALEARFAAAIRHEHVVSIFAVSELEGVPFLVMEYVQGASLQDCLDDGQTFTIAEIARIARQTALGLAAAHDLRLIHRDIKPANILLEKGTKHVRVADFGLARALDHESQITQNGSLTGTPLFMSPEQVDGLPLTPASDLFSMGSVLYYLCTGELPFDGETVTSLLYAVALKNPKPIRDLNPDIPAWLAHVIEKLHAKKIEDRFPSAAAVADYLKPWLG